MVQDITKQVKRRRVFYIPGYDPFPARRYRELYRSEGQNQADLSGYELELTGKSASDVYGWQVHATVDGQVVDADIDVLVWSDIVQDSMATGILATYWQMVRTAWIYIQTGALRRMMWLRKGPIIAALYPVGMLLLQLLLAVIVFWFVSRLTSTLMHMVVELFTGPVLFGPAFVIRTYLSMAFGVVAGVFVLRWFKSMDHKVFAYYLMHDYAFIAQNRGAYPPELEARMQRFGDAIGAALRDNVDEVLVVGHSSGAHLAVSILADLVRAGRVPKNGPALAFLSLGQVVPMVSFLPNAQRLRADLHDLSNTDALTWVDVTAPGDGCSFALCDPVSVSGVAPKSKRWPLVFSAAFSKSLSPAKWKALRRRYFRLHFQYLCAFDQPMDYDYFQITAGPLTLAERYRDRAPSKSRIDVSASPYTSVSA